MELKNNTILITGGASGLGLQFATQLINLGNTVIILSWKMNLLCNVD